MKLITSRDTDVGEGEFDSIAWAFSEHVKQDAPAILKSAILSGNEDAPDKIEFYKQAVPAIKDKVIAVWTPEGGLNWVPNVY